MMGPVAEEEPRIADEESIDLIDYLEVIWAHRWMIGLGTAAAIALAAIFSLTTSPTYQASMLLKPGSMFVSGKSDGTSVIEPIEDPKTIAQVLTGDAMVLELKNFLGLDEMSLGGLRQTLSVKTVKGDGNTQSNLLELNLKLSNPQYVVDGLNFLADRLIQEHRTRYEAGLAVIDQESKGLQEKIASTRAQRETLQKKIVEIRQHIVSELRYRDGISATIDRLEADIAGNRTNFSQMKPSTTEAVLGQGLLQSLELRLNDLKVERNNSHNRVRGWQSEIYGLEVHMAALDEQRTDFESAIVQFAGYRARSENTRVRSAPVLPTTPVASRLGLKMALAGLLGLMVCIMAAFLREYVRNARRRRLFAQTFSTND